MRIQFLPDGPDGSFCCCLSVQDFTGKYAPRRHLFVTSCFL